MGPRRVRDLLLALAIVGLDQWTKALVRASLPLHGDRPVLRDLLSIVHGRNQGMAFGLLSEGERPYQAALLTAASLLGIAAVALYWSRLPLERGQARAALALVMGGAAGNLLDRVQDGFVTDFVHVYWHHWTWWDFNLADSAIAVGLALLVLERRPAKAAPEAEA